ncbi:hypothetical protein VN97_g7509 [Penicillium thymicola]|uniref:Uncharacterized protein n=1 Tax=Penicillium thymicola TaxID=293382 RepID=A0AAI9TG95_PENTH|nr:hypothetical protein VN97_g7509 [Penicillium thymicola]
MVRSVMFAPCHKIRRYKDSPTPKLAAKRSANFLQIQFKFNSDSIHFRSPYTDIVNTINSFTNDDERWRTSEVWVKVTSSGCSQYFSLHHVDSSLLLSLRNNRIFQLTYCFSKSKHFSLLSNHQYVT